jgi:predicted metalloprotease with PDZ domain
VRLAIRWSTRLVFFALACALVAASASATIRYGISLANPEQHLFHVTMTIPDVKGEVTIQMPAWNALYQIRDFASHVREVAAFSGTTKLPIEKIDKQTWVIHGSGEITVRYATWWDEPGPFGTQLNAHHAFINPAMILMYVPDRRAEKALVTFADLQADWRLQSPGRIITLQAGMPKFTWMEEPNYDSLADSPIEVGKFDGFGFDAANGKAPITVVVDSEDWHRFVIEKQFRKICEYEIRLMGGAPFPRYTFILHIGKEAEDAGGGMEHADGTAIYVPSEDRLAGVAAHEFFHLWNVKRIRPASLEPVDYTKEQYTKSLWFAEGVTSTYGSYTLVRTGLWTKEQFYAELGDRISDLESRPANKWQSAEQSSLDAWLEKYPWYNAPDFSVSYYTKGQILGVLLDILIRDKANNTKSLDDVMRLMNDEFAKKGKPYNDDADIQASIEKVAGSSFREFFEKYVAGTEPLPYADILRLAGLELRNAPARPARAGHARSVALEIVEDANANEKARRIRDGILKGETQAAVAAH